MTRARLRREDRLVLERLFTGLGAIVIAAIVAARCERDGDRRVPRLWPRAQILAAIRFVESGDRADPPDGDLGLAIGPFQIHEIYWRDALRQRPALGGAYADCRRRDYAEQVVAAYMERWVPAAWAAGDAEVIARTHNGGPGGAARAATVPYWQRVAARLSR
jgi:hypothetical protein